MLPVRPLVLTLDDGHSGNFHLHATIQAHHAPVALFVCSDIVGSFRGFWFNHTSDPQSLMLVPDEKRLSLLSSAGFHEGNPLPRREALSLEEMHAMAGPLVEFQSHSATHAILPRCSSEKAWTEIRDSRDKLATCLGTSISGFAFPAGIYGQRELEMVRASGYTFALTTKRGSNTLRSDPYTLRRIGISDDASYAELVVKASGAWTPIETVYNLAVRLRAQFSK